MLVNAILLHVVSNRSTSSIEVNVSIVPESGRQRPDYAATSYGSVVDFSIASIGQCQINTALILFTCSFYYLRVSTGLGFADPDMAKHPLVKHLPAMAGASYCRQHK